MKIVFLVVLISFTFFIVNSTKSPKRSDLRRLVMFNYIGNCPKKNNLPVIFGNFSIEQIGKSEYVANGYFELKNRFPDGFKGTIIL